MPKIKVVVTTGYVDARHVDYADLPDDWEEYQEEEREEFLNQVAVDTLNNYCEASAWIVNDDEEEY